MYTFVDLQNEVKRRATRDQAGTSFNTAVKNIINTSLFRINREAPWRTMRRRTHFRTIGPYNEGSGAGAYTTNTSTITITGATFLSHGIQIGRRIKLSGDAGYHIVRKVTGETAITMDTGYSNASSTTTGTYSVLGQEEYNLPIQAGHRMFMWHEAWGYPYKMQYITDQDFYGTGAYNTEESIPTHYRMWGEDMIIDQLREDSVIRVVSSSTSDTSKGITVFGNVSGFPDYEVITTNGTTAVSGSKSFQTVERVVKNASTAGRITVDANSGNTVVAVLPVGDTTAGIMYRKVQLYPLPDDNYDVNVQYYKDPYRLVEDDDVHELGQDFDEAIVLLATSKIKGETEIKQGTTTFFGFYQDELKSLKKTNADKIDWFPSLRKPSDFSRDPLVHPHLSYKQIGGYYGPRVG